ncbi:MAG: DUF134 domain-containing protein [Chloroflexi bacterium]|nr:DUF134 domain-containing protein [Chloroflexota bacterium]MBM3183096.1 DUF134 domain-containing protein [Chloroflexota bacterium]MBM4454137.1 DUF134 domain-containing protein [Chloroflexota bacterium]
MPRPRRCRRIAFLPGADYFKPAGIPLRELDEVHLALEEAEAIRLKDLEDLEQEECAQRMNISRPTFQRVLDSARKKVADALLNGKAIRIFGGDYEMPALRWRCEVGHEWDVASEALSQKATILCPTCGLPGISPYG